MKLNQYSFFISSLLILNVATALASIEKFHIDTDTVEQPEMLSDTALDPTATDINIPPIPIVTL